ncbi:MAG: gluconate 2-dehydrogenase subunit 3 family protein [Pseudomonadales bacterium]
MNRRDFLQCAALITVGASQAPKGWALSEEQNTFLAAQPPYVNRVARNFFTEAQRNQIAAMAELIIPKTDTPGAIDAEVPTFIEGMVATWFNDQERDHFMRGLTGVNERAKGFLNLSQAEQVNLLENLESEASDAPWYQFGNTLRVWDSEAPFICQLKELTILGFMLSETAGQSILRPEIMGAFDGSVDLLPDDTVYTSISAGRSVKPPIQI